MGAINSGDLRERIMLLTPAPAVKDAGGYGYVASGLESEQGLWARVKPLRPTESLQLGQTLNPETYEITLRNRPDVSAKQRIRWNGKTLNIQGIKPAESKEYLLLTCIHGGQ